MKERRRYPRMDVNVKVNYREVENSKEVKKAESLNISAEGFCFCADEKLELGTKLELELLTRGDEKPIKVRGRVVWSEKIKDKNSYYTGIQLLDVGKADESRFLTLYCNRLVDRLGGQMHV